MSPVLLAISCFRKVEIGYCSGQDGMIKWETGLGIRDLGFGNPAYT